MTEMSGRRYAVLIASSQFPDESKLQDLRCPENDVDGINSICGSKTHGDFTETFVLKNRPHHEVLLKINQVLNQAGKNDLVLIYYSGHGKLDRAGRLHLTTIDTVVDALGSTSIPVASIKDYVDVSPSTKVILILDCCFSGAVEKAFLRSSVDDQLQLASGGRGTYIMTASTGIQVAQERESDEYGIFTKHIIEGIKGGEADRDEDGLVSVGELYSYVHDRVLEEGFQEPMKWDLNVRGELVLARSGKSPREERRRQMRGMLLDLKGILPDRIMSKAIYVIALTPTECVGELRSYYDLVERLFQKRLEVGEFLEEWFKLKSEPSARASEEKQVPQAKPPETEQQPTTKRAVSSAEGPATEIKETERPRVKPSETERQAIPEVDLPAADVSAEKEALRKLTYLQTGAASCVIALPTSIGFVRQMLGYVYSPDREILLLVLGAMGVVGILMHQKSRLCSVKPGADLGRFTAYVSFACLVLLLIPPFKDLFYRPYTGLYVIVAVLSLYGFCVILWAQVVLRAIRGSGADDWESQ